MHYKAPDNSLHFIEPEFAHLLPTGSVPITEEEAKLLQPKPDPKLQLLEQISELELKVTPRRIREALLTGDTSFIQNIEDKIKELRNGISSI